ncbi:MAG: hypothetical protein WAO74_04675 [Polaribacter sp.]|uniref:hypothetical protein n=1 Tax=Polaribacter sp. TaxID=1920175 RepID=UPI003BB0D9B2
MKPLKKAVALLMLLIGIFSFNKAENTTTETNLNLEEINVIALLSEQGYECRPTSDFMFYVETSLIKKERGSNSIDAKVFVLNRKSGQRSLLSNEIIQVPNFEGTTMIFEGEVTVSDCGKDLQMLTGDKVMVSAVNMPYCFNDLIKYESIYNSYIKSTNKLLDLKRSI